MTTPSSRRRAAVVLGGAMACTLLVAAMQHDGDPDRRAMGPSAVPSEAAPVASVGAAVPPTYRVETDHAVYETPADLGAHSGLVLTGVVSSHVVDPGVSPGTDGAGDPIPPIPQTDYTVEVVSVLKGGAAGPTVTVSVPGGVSDVGKFVVDGVPAATDGGEYLFFLDDVAADGKYYPIAGGAAVAAKVGATYVVPASATGLGDGLPVTPEQVAGSTHPAPAPASQVTPTAPASPASSRTTTVTGWPGRVVTSKRRAVVTVTVTPSMGRPARVEERVCTAKKNRSRCVWRTVRTSTLPATALGTARVRLAVSASRTRSYRLVLTTTPTADAFTTRTLKVSAKRKR